MCGVASRRKADEIIVAGEVTVNGKRVHDLGTKISPQRDVVRLGGRQIVQTHDFLYLVLNKPKDTITTLQDERGRKTVMSLVRSNRRIYPVGRLDRNTTGVLLLTNDGGFAHALMHPRHEVPKSYLITCETAVSAEHIDQLRRGVRLDDGKTAPAEVFVIPKTKRKEIGVTIHEGRNRQVRRMLETLGYAVRKLERVAYGPVTTAGLKRGETRSLTHQEVRQLRALAGMESPNAPGGINS
jgi:23S rRNA pseudouridine2605 synthase